MALIRCPDCGNEHSDAAKACPHCGRPVALGDSPLAHLDDEQLHGIVLCGKYQLEYPVGKGGMAYVYRAKHVQFHRPVAIKLIFRHLVKEEVMQYRFRTEAQIQFSLQHPNIVRVIDFVEEQGLLGFVMDWVEGLTLSQWLRKQTFPTSPEIFLPVIGPILEGMHYAHSQRVIHRDLKPGNLLLADTERGMIPKIVDFGIAKVMDNVNDGHTVTGHSLGTPTYMSPEQIRSSKEIDNRSDLYSLAVILFQMITGVPPFKKETPMATAMAHLEERLPRIDIIRPGADMRFQPVLEKALAKDRNDRYPDGRSFLLALQEAAELAGASQVAAESKPSFPNHSTTEPPSANPVEAASLHSSTPSQSTLSLGDLSKVPMPGSEEQGEAPPKQESPKTPPPENKEESASPSSPSVSVPVSSPKNSSTGIMPPFPSLSSPMAPLSFASGVFPSLNAPLSLALSTEDVSNTPLPLWQAKGAASQGTSSPSGELSAPSGTSSREFPGLSLPLEQPTPAPFVALASPEIPQATKTSRDDLEAFFEQELPDHPLPPKPQLPLLVIIGVLVVLLVGGGILWLGRKSAVVKPPVAEKLVLTLNSLPQNAKVYLKGQFKGKTPLQMNAKQGEELTFSLRLDGFAQQSYVWTVTRAEAKTVALRKLFTLSLESKPSGASVFLDDKLIGVTPQPIFLPAGQLVQIKLVMKGHIARKIAWKAERSEQKLIYLAPDVFDPE